MARFKQKTITIFPNGVAVRGINRQTLVRKQDKNPEKEFLADNVIHLKALVANVGIEAGVKHEVSYNNKIKYSHMGLTDEAVVELYVALGRYIQEFKLK